MQSWADALLVCDSQGPDELQPGSAADLKTLLAKDLARSALVISEANIRPE